MALGNLLVIQAGGPTQVVNESLVAVLTEARERRGAARVFGARRGMAGLIRDDLVELSSLTLAQLRQIRRSPGAVLGSSRVRPSRAELAVVVDHLGRQDIHQALFIGGNGTMCAALELSRFACSLGYELQVMGIPKTIDNDINGTDRCPGYASAANFVAQSTRDLGMDVRSLSQPVSILETMGREVGWLAAASVVARVTPHDAPHLVYIPEIPFAIDRFLGDLDAVLQRQDWAIVVVSEGIRDGSGRSVYENVQPSQKDEFNRALPGGVAHYLAEVVTHRLKIRCRDEKPGLLGRASMYHVSSQDRVDAERVGRAAFRAIEQGDTGQMVALTPMSNSGDTTTLVPLESVGGPARSVPREWIVDANPPTNGDFTAYLRPLIGNLLEYENVFYDA